LTVKRDGFQNKQISVVKTGKRILEVIDSLQLSSMDCAEKIHALSEKAGGCGKRVYSRIKLRLVNIESGPNSQLEFNLTPDEVLWLAYRAKIGVTYKQDYTDTLFRHWPGQDGLIIKPSLTIKYTRYANRHKTELMRYPFRVEIKRVEGTPDEKGEMISVKGETKIDMLLSDQGFYSLLNDALRYLKLWELAFGCRQIKERHKIDEALAASGAANMRLKQIYVRKTAETIIECLDSLKLAAVEYAENVYAGERYYIDGETSAELNGPKNLARDYARITVKIRDFKNKTAEGKQLTAGFALSVADINYLAAAVEPSMLFQKDFSFSGFRKWSINQGTVAHAMVYMQYQRYTDGTKKDEYAYPYYILITNRTGKGDKTGNKIVNIESETEMSVRLAPFEFFSMINDCLRYMSIFEAAYGVKNIACKLAQEKKRHEDFYSEQYWNYCGAI